MAKLGKGGRGGGGGGGGWGCGVVFRRFTLKKAV